MSKIYFVFAKDLHIPPSEIDEMYWYDIMFILKEYTTYVEESNEESQRRRCRTCSSRRSRSSRCRIWVRSRKDSEFRFPNFREPIFI